MPLFCSPSKPNVWLAPAAEFWAKRQGEADARRFGIHELDGAKVDNDNIVRLSDGTVLRAVEVIPAKLPLKPSELDWRIVRNHVRPAPGDRVTDGVPLCEVAHAIHPRDTRRSAKLGGEPSQDRIGSGCRVRERTPVHIHDCSVQVNRSRIDPCGTQRHAQVIDGGDETGAKEVGPDAIRDRAGYSTTDRFGSGGSRNRTRRADPEIVSGHQTHFAGYQDHFGRWRRLCTVRG